MRLNLKLAVLLTISLSSGCIHKGPNPADPYESLNRKVHDFNRAFDATMLKPPAKLYKAILPATVRGSINHFYMNINLIPTVANDLLQADWRYAIKDTWRFFINSTLGVAGLFDIATKFSLPPHSNDLGLTFAKWGYQQSAYLVIPILGPSTYRDGYGMLIEYGFLSPYVFIDDEVILYSLLGIRMIDLRSQYLDVDPVLAEALDHYSFVRDAYLQKRQFEITGEKESSESDSDELYVDEH